VRDDEGMESRKFDELESRSAALQEAEMRDALRKAQASATIHGVLAEMKREGKAFELTEEEELMLVSFRRFKLRMKKDGEVFTWQTRRGEGVQLATDTALMSHPNEK